MFALIIKNDMLDHDDDLSTASGINMLVVSLVFLATRVVSHLQDWFLYLPSIASSFASLRRIMLLFKVILGLFTLSAVIAYPIAERAQLQEKGAMVQSSSYILCI